MSILRTDPFIKAFFESQGTNYGNRFKVNGQVVGEDHSTGLAVMNAVASLAATNPRSREFVEVLWDTPTPHGHWRYYDGLLYMLAMLHCSGEFQIWPPK